MAVLPPLDHAVRSERLRARLGEDGLDALVVSGLDDVRYLTGFTGSSATVMVTDDSVVFVTDGRYRDQAADQLRGSGVDAEILIDRDHLDVLAPRVEGLGRVGLQADHVTWAEQRQWAQRVATELTPVVGMLLEMRAVKDEPEVERLRLASRIADDALAAVRPLLATGPSERDVARALEAEMVARGAEGPSFETIVASGPNSSRPHARPSDRIVGSSGEPELVVLDFGALVDGYHSDMTRTIVVGDPTATQARMLEVVTDAQARGRAIVRMGVTCAAVDAACRSHIADHGWGDAFLHPTGHGIGLVIHEEPRVTATSRQILAPGHCVTVEPGVYLPDHGGVRVEDSLVVTALGHEVLTRSPYDHAV